MWSTWDALGLVQAKFGDIKSFLQSLSKALHEQDGHDGSPMVSVPLMTAEDSQASFFLPTVRALFLSWKSVSEPGSLVLLRAAAIMYCKRPQPKEAFLAGAETCDTSTCAGETWQQAAQQPGAVPAAGEIHAWLLTCDF